ncbi:protein phosphatase 1 regulatory subunit 42 [Synchiropus splendidus]|uniref:protein phosphatase 1 regulatory subunit 42 n=1 Tax=Synchiropus splendidus TaxID=270530 RepID=UPI00237D384A|nr:protein phosphatase 1 regulatory subunit 42 [Synchiropus splendidus]XP_053716194.1 protein phosphatase 1 regulatory subunit 42 [Synchiropus splendidus]
MVRLTLELIAKTQNKKKRGLNLKTLTHLHFSSKNIEEIDDFSVCRNLTVLYLYDNHITHIPNLDFATKLTELYMQNNCIWSIRGLSALHSLTKLYLGGNRIAVVEGLEQLTELKELRVENQRLAPGEKLLFDPPTLHSLAESLCILNISKNNIDQVRDLAVLKELQHFSASDNQLHNMKELESVCSRWPQLLHMDLRGNPVCKTQKYRDRLITSCLRIQVLDGCEINETNRQFLINWKAVKVEKKRRHKLRNGDAGSDPLNFSFNVGQDPHPGGSYSHTDAGPRALQPDSVRLQQLQISVDGRVNPGSVINPLEPF